MIPLTTFTRLSFKEIPIAIKEAPIAATIDVVLNPKKSKIQQLKASAVKT